MNMIEHAEEEKTMQAIHIDTVYEQFTEKAIVIF